MANSIKIYNIKDFIKKTVSGEIDYSKSIAIVQELAYAANFHPDHNILVDMRSTTLGKVNLSTLLQLTFELGYYKSCFKNKIANLIPDDPERIRIAEQFKLCLDYSGFQYEIFVDYEAAIEWLSDVSAVQQKV